MSVSLPKQVDGSDSASLRLIATSFGGSPPTCVPADGEDIENLVAA